MRGTDRRRGWLVGLGGALGLLLAGAAMPETALADSVRIESHRAPGGSTPWRGDRDWRRPGGDWGDRGHRDRGHGPFVEKGPHHGHHWKHHDHRPHWGHRHPHGAWWGAPAPVWVPPHWAWDGWRWVWFPGYWR